MRKYQCEVISWSADAFFTMEHPNIELETVSTRLDEEWNKYGAYGKRRKLL